MPIVLECNTDRVKAACKHLRVALPKNKRDRATAVLEINFHPQEVKLTVIGATYRLGIQPGLFAKVLLPFVFFDKALKDWQAATFIASFENGLFTFGGTSMESEVIKVVHPENQPKIELAINSSDADFLALEYRYSIDELKRMNLLGRIDKAKDNLDGAIRNALGLLSAYGVRYTDLAGLVVERIRARNHHLNS